MPNRSLVFQPPVIAHRGASNRAPENTMAAFIAAREDGAGWINTSVKLTADGVPVLIHDDTLDRTTDGQGKVADATWAEMRALDAGAWFAPSFAASTVPTLTELLAFARATGVRLNLELKPCPGRRQATVMVALIEAAQLWAESAPPLLISSADIDALIMASRLHPGWPRGLIMDDWRDDWRKMVTMTHATSVHVNADLLTPDRLGMLRESNLSLLAFTVNDNARAKALLHNGVRAVASDNPGAVIKGI